MLQYVGKHHLKYAGSNQWFIRSGPGFPENTWSNRDFDGQLENSFNNNRWNNHLSDYDKNPGDTWKSGKGKAMMGMCNYLVEQGVNTIYALFCNIGGDGRDVWPYVYTPTSSTTVAKNEAWGGKVPTGVFDISKLEQWDHIVTHMNNVGIAPVLLFLEVENENELDAGDMWKLIYREMIARFNHHLGAVWVLSEEQQHSLLFFH